MYRFSRILFVCIQVANCAAGFENSVEKLDNLLSESELFNQFQQRLAALEERELEHKRLILQLTDDLAEQRQENLMLRETVEELKSQLDNKDVELGNFSQTFMPEKVVSERTKQHKPVSATSRTVKNNPRRGISRRQSNQATVAFSAGLTHRFLHAGKDQNIVFDSVQVNIGNGYNPHHGAFIAPVAGTYVFHSSILADNDREVWCRFFVNGVYGDAIYARGTDGRHDQGSQMLIVQLNQGDDVSVQNIAADDAIYGDGSMYSTFSGFLLQGDGEFIVG